MLEKIERNSTGDRKLSNMDTKAYTGGLDVKPTNLTGTLERHPKKKYKTRRESRIDMVVVHCTDRDWSIEELVEYDVKGKLIYERKRDKKIIVDTNHINSNGLPGITYHDCVTEDSVLHTLPYIESSYHAGGYNSRSVAIAMIYRTTNPETRRAEYAPPEGMVKLTQCHAAELCLRFGLNPSRIFGHRELKGTGWDWIRGRKRLLKSCPGPHVDLDLLRKNAALYMQVKLYLKGHYTGEIDGLFGKKSMAALEKW